MDLRQHVTVWPLTDIHSLSTVDLPIPGPTHKVVAAQIAFPFKMRAMSRDVDFLAQVREVSGRREVVKSQ
jgi:hypothetical protein